MNSRMLALVIVVAMLFSNMGAANADTRRELDRDDAQGFLDIRWVAHGHGYNAAAETAVRHRIETFASWKSRDLPCGAMGFVFGRRNRYVRVYYDNGLKAEMIDTTNGHVIGRTQVWRPTARSLTVQFPKRWLGDNVASYRWAARTETYGGACSPFVGDPPEHPDEAPEYPEWVVHDLRR